MSDQVEFYDDTVANPLDHVEDVLSDHNWVYSRMNDEELIVEVAGKSCDYRLLFVWQEHMNSLQLCCQYGMQINENNIGIMATALMDMNTSLWMGHFELTKDTLSPCFRQTCLLHGHDHKRGHAYIEELVDISLVLCERYHTVFHLLASDKEMDIETLSFAMMDTAGES